MVWAKEDFFLGLCLPRLCGVEKDFGSVGAE